MTRTHNPILPNTGDNTPPENTPENTTPAGTPAENTPPSRVIPKGSTLASPLRVDPPRVDDDPEEKPAPTPTWHKLTAEMRNTSDIFLDSKVQAWSVQVSVGDTAYAQALLAAIRKVNDEWDDKQKVIEREHKAAEDKRLAELRSKKS